MRASVADSGAKVISLASCHFSSCRYLPAFEDCIKRAGAQSVMCSYNAINGVPACADAKLLNAQLRQEYGFRGFVVSDYGAIPALQTSHHYVSNNIDGVADALSSGSVRRLVNLVVAFFVFWHSLGVHAGVIKMALVSLAGCTRH